MKTCLKIFLSQRGIGRKDCQIAPAIHPHEESYILAKKRHWKVFVLVEWKWHPNREFFSLVGSSIFWGTWQTLLRNFSDLGWALGARGRSSSCGPGSLVKSWPWWLVSFRPQLRSKWRSASQLAWRQPPLWRGYRGMRCPWCEPVKNQLMRFYGTWDALP